MSFQLSGTGPEIYETTLVPLWFGRWAEALMEIALPEDGEQILDIACGTGVTTRLAKRAVGDQGRVVGLDINAGMLTKAETLADQLDIEWLEGDAGNTGLPVASFDLIISQHGYHYFPDKPAALAEFLRVLKPNGRLGFSIWDGHSAYTKALCNAVERHISPEVAKVQRSQRETPSAEQLELEVANEGFRHIVVHRQELLIKVPLARKFVPLHLGSMPIAEAFNGLADQQKNALINEVEEALTDYVDVDQIVYPDAVHVVSAVK